jgi:hypothetical protein
MFIFFRLSAALTRRRARALEGGGDSAWATPVAIRVQFLNSSFLEYFLSMAEYGDIFFFFGRVHCIATD